MKSILHRISDFIDYQGITITNLEREIGASKGVLSRALANGTDIQSKWVQRIVENYHSINPTWLLTGEGEMLRSKREIKPAAITRHHQAAYKEKELPESVVPLFDIDAAANLHSIFSQKDQNVIDTLSIPGLPQCDGAVYVRGDSMYPLIGAGDIIIFKMIEDFNVLVYGEMYLIDFTIAGVDYLVLKYIRRSNITDHIQLISHNTLHDPMDIPITGCIRAMAIVKASIRFNTMA